MATLDGKRCRLLDIFSGYGRVAVAFSAGVDSTVVAKAAALTCRDNAVAVTAVSPSLPDGEADEAQRLAAQIGIRHRLIVTGEFDNPDYLRNAPNRCYVCKIELYSRLAEQLDELEVDIIVNGANLDDEGDYRPGMRAAAELAVRSPLIEAELTKSDVRELARYWDLPVWNKPASPCLSSRIAYGLAVTPERVERVDKAERFLRTEFGVRELRVRHEENTLARIEVPFSVLPRLIEPAARKTISDRFHALGFQYVTIDLDGFRSGSMNVVLPLEQLQRQP